MNLEPGQLWMHRVTGHVVRIEQLVTHGAKVQPVDDATHEPKGEPVGMTYEAITGECMLMDPVAKSLGVSIQVTSDGKVRLTDSDTGAEMYISPLTLVASAAAAYKALDAAGVAVERPSDSVFSYVVEAIKAPPA